MSLVSVYKASDATQAVIISNLLRGAGIEAEVRTDDANGLLPSLDLSEGVDVLVDASDAEEAGSVLEQFKRGETAIGEDAGE